MTYSVPMLAMHQFFQLRLTQDSFTNDFVPSGFPRVAQKASARVRQPELPGLHIRQRSVYDAIIDGFDFEKETQSSRRPEDCRRAQYRSEGDVSWSRSKHASLLDFLMPSYARLLNLVGRLGETGFGYWIYAAPPNHENSVVDQETTPV